jgi:hypothetical protein
MTKYALLSFFFLLFGVGLRAQPFHLEPSVGLDNGFRYADVDQFEDTSLGVEFKRQRFTLPVYSLGLARTTKRNALQTLNLQFVYRNTSVADLIDTISTVSPANFVGEQEVLRLALLFEHLYRLNPSKSGNQFFLGFAFAGAYESFTFEPTSALYFPENSKSFALDASAVFRYQYQWQNDWRLFAGLGIGALKADLETYRIENPSLTEEQQENQVFELEAGSRWQLRVGVGIPLGKNATTSSSPQ